MTDREKYNNKSSIDINSLSKEELAVAIREWAEGDPYLEKFLWRCYENNVETMACNSSWIYIDFSPYSEIEKIKNILDSVSDANGFQIMVKPDGGHPFSGNMFYKTVISLSLINGYTKKENDVFFTRMINSLDKKENSNNKMIDNMFDLCLFFSGKESELSFRLRLENNSYIFMVDLNAKSRYDYYNDIFTKVGMEYVEEDKSWQISSKDKDDFTRKLSNIKEHLISSYSLNLKDKLDEDMSFNEKFVFLHRKYIEKYGNDTLFMNILSDFEKRMYKEEKRIKMANGTFEEYNNWLNNEILKIESDINNSVGNK